MCWKCFFINCLFFNFIYSVIWYIKKKVYVKFCERVFLNLEINFDFIGLRELGESIIESCVYFY